ncbi:ubiquinone/menaquinone biosynthesis methyltransferase [Legionella lansingensis]|uniref:Ubiquinone/menaquinone biosynthesis methyltransferase n=1 Tax=Legionella lansingensis TaxID=45067 RepID=A0A0W0VIW7_9GAMM|nr:class I SAM-dependent methyltransferase [Legionella lansingensis]KTD20065.1 ubiquinone/menaquinone biosynthesis methyltransferase [Legionella lansingensis]SNV51016.1 ubiquinone/menaquinone biosynthesis methyltransferase [Legionella lansingensis]
MDYVDHFNQDSAQYLLFRPTYPDDLYRYLTKLIENGCVWDCATGNGQAALALANYFSTVIATDINPQPLKFAANHPNIQYICCPAENTPLQDNSMDLITVAQALHWFNFELFYQEVRRVAKPSAYMAAWCYTLGKFHLPIDEVIGELYYRILGNKYWPKERHYVDDAYTTIPFPFTREPTPSFFIEKDMNLNQLVGYLKTWSAVKEYQLHNQEDPIQLIINKLQDSWGEPNLKHTINWPLHLLVGKIN